MNTEAQNLYKQYQKDLTTEKNFEAVGRYFYTGDPDTSVKHEFTRNHYEYFRPNQRIPKGINQHELREIMMKCHDAYDRVGIIRAVIDLMSEFGAEGVDIVHSDIEPHTFYQAWKQKVNLEDRAERFLSWLFKNGNVVCRRIFGQIDSPRIKKLKNQGIKNAGSIPVKFTFYDPSTIELIGDSFASISSTKKYGLRIPMNNLLNYKKPRTKSEQEVFDSIPKEIKDLIEKRKFLKGHYLKEIPNDKIFIGHYKKDDTQMWAKSFIYSVLSDVDYNDKVKLAKLSSLDNMINPIRLWKLGDQKQGLYPDPSSGAKLANIISNNTGGGPIDIIWGYDIELEEFYPPLEKLQHFQEDTEAILLGLGFPQGLLGGGDSEGKGAITANAISLKNLIKKLEAGRREIKKWLYEEIKIINKNMGFRKMPEIRFAHSDLYDDKTYFDLLIKLVDRNILPDERILEIINEIPEFEQYRVRLQEQKRNNGELPKKAGPFNNPEQDNKKQNQEQSPGRPGGSTDKVKRLRRVSTQAIVGAMRIYDEAFALANDVALHKFNKKSVRELSSKEKEFVDAGVNYILNSLEFNHNIDFEKLNLNNLKPLVKIENFYSNEAKTNDEKRIIKILAYLEAWGIE